MNSLTKEENVILLQQNNTNISGQDMDKVSAVKLFPHPGNKGQLAKFVPVYTYSVANRAGGLLKSELLHIMCHLAKCELFLSVILFAYGIVRPWYSTIKTYADMCTISMLAGSAGVFTGLFGFAAICKFRWKCLMVVYLVLSILASVTDLLLLIFASVWLGDLGKLTNPFKFMIHVTVTLLLLSIAIGVCFILTSAFICNFWTPDPSKRKSYRLLGHVQLSNSSDELIDDTTTAPLINEVDELAHQQLQKFDYRFCDNNLNER